MVGTAIIARMTAGMAVHTTSSFVFPWICSGSASSGRPRNLKTVKSSAPSTSTKTIAAHFTVVMNTSSETRAASPRGASVVCGYCSAAHPARASTSTPRASAGSRRRKARARAFLKCIPPCPVGLDVCRLRGMPGEKRPNLAAGPAQGQGTRARIARSTASGARGIAAESTSRPSAVTRTSSSIRIPMPSSGR